MHHNAGKYGIKPLSHVVHSHKSSISTNNIIATNYSRHGNLTIELLEPGTRLLGSGNESLVVIAEGCVLREIKQMLRNHSNGKINFYPKKAKLKFKERKMLYFLPTL